MRKTKLFLLLFLAVGILVTTPFFSFMPLHDGTVGAGEVLRPFTSEHPNTAVVSGLPSLASTELPRPDGDGTPLPNGVTTIFEWWNTSWHYRIRLEVDALSSDRFNVTIPVHINLTQWLDDVGISETVDENSTRIVEEDASSGDVITEQPSVFFKDATWDAATNATGWILFFLNGSMPATTNRTVFVYFDTTAKGTKDLPNYPEVVNGWSSEYFGYNGGHFSMPSETFYLWRNLDSTTNQISYQDGGGNNFPTGADGSGPDWERFSANYSAWLPVTVGGSYGFQTSSDDGSWFYVNDTLVVNNGGGHGTRTISGSISLTPGLYPLWVPWYENTGGATIYARWQAPGDSSYTYLTDANVTAIRWGVSMDMNNPCNLTWGTTIGIYLLRAHVENADGANMVNIPVHLLNATNPSEVFDTVYTDMNGNASFNVIQPGDYILRANYTTAYPTSVPTKLNITDQWSFNLNSSVEGELLDHDFHIAVTDVTYTVYDLDSGVMVQSPTETTRVYIYNDTYPTYLASQATDGSGQVTFEGFPVGMYNVSWDYTNALYPNDYGEPDVPNNETAIYNTFTHDMIIPLVDLSVEVLSYEGSPVPNVLFDFDSQSYPTLSVQSWGPVTDAQGKFTFGHILNGSWIIDAYRDDDYGQNTVTQTTISFATTIYTPGSPLQINFPLDNLRIHVQERDSGSPLAGANVTVWTPNWASLIASSQTDGNGDVTFTWLKNATYWLNATTLGAYAQPGDQFPTVDLHNIAPDYTSVVTVRIFITFDKLDCAFFLDNSTIIYMYFNSNFTLRFKFVNVTGGLPDIPIDDTIAEWINFTLTHSGLSQPIMGTWNQSDFYLVYHETGGYWYIWINTSAWNLAPSAEPYIVSIDGYAINGTTAFNSPETLTISIYVETTPTSLTNPGTQNVIWSDVISFAVTYTDSNHTLPISGANVEFLITGAYSSAGTLTDAGNGIYSFAYTAAALNLPSGSYTLMINATFDNYVGQIIFLTLNINAIPTDGSLTPAVITLNWSASFLLQVNYSYAADGLPVIGATVEVMWGGVPSTLLYNSGNSLYEIMLYGSDWTIGSHLSITVTAQYGNHTTQNLSFDATITNSPTSATDPPDYMSQSWGLLESYSIIFTDLNTSTDISGAQITLNLTLGYWNVLDHGDGTYTISVTMTFEPGTYDVEMTIELYGYTSQVKTFTIELLTPLQIEAVNPEGISIYWTETFDISVYVIDTSSMTNVTGATVTWNWTTYTDVPFDWSMNVYTTHNPIQATMFGAPSPLGQPYIVEITATFAGASTAKGYVYVEVIANPTDLTREGTADVTITWGENGTIYYSFNDTLSGSIGIDGATVEAYIVDYGYADIIDYGTGRYAIVIPTGTLGMDAPGSYTLTILFYKTGYADGTGAPVAILCQVRATTINVVVSPNEIMIGTPTVDVWADYIDDLTSGEISDATLTLSLSTPLGVTFFTANMAYNAVEGRYYYELFTGGLPMDAYQIRVIATEANYAEGDQSVVLQVIEPGFEIPGTGIYITLSQLLFAVAGIAIVILAFAGYVGYKRATIPYQLKALNKAIKAINKSRPADVHPSLLNREDKMKQSLRRFYRKAGITYEEEDAAG